MGTLFFTAPLVSKFAALGSDGRAVTLQADQFGNVVSALRGIFNIVIPLLGVLFAHSAWRLWGLVKYVSDKREPSV